ncbi:MAG: glucose-6-phosphate isomerase [Bacillota bacterium]
MIKFDEKYCYNAVTKEEIDNIITQNKQLICDVLGRRVGMQNFLGWYSVGENATREILRENEVIADEILQNADAFVIVGVGGSNRSAQTLIEGLNKKNGKVEIFYAGNNLSGSYLAETLQSLKGKNVYVNIIAKDFNTLEPGIAFRMLRGFLKEQYGSEYNKHVILTGSEGEGQLYEISKRENMRFLHFPKEVGGRFTAFTSVSFLPMLVAGVDIYAFIAGGNFGVMASLDSDLHNNIAVRYAAARYALSQKGFMVESFCNFEPRMEYFSKWALQLHGESEGKNQNAILPTIANFSEDLHAIGQYIAEGKKFIFETFLDFRNKTNIKIQNDGFCDGFEYLDGKDFDALNDAVLHGSRKAHFEAGVPVLTFSADEISEITLGELMYVFMMSTYLSSALIGVEPFDQNGVEGYKKNMYKLLEKNK